MSFHILTTYSAAEYEVHLRKAHERRAATFWSATAPLREAGGWLFETVRRLASAVRARRERVEALRQLHRMDAGQLADIGLTRADLTAFDSGVAIERVAGAPAEEAPGPAAAVPQRDAAVTPSATRHVYPRRTHRAPDRKAA